MKMTPEHKKKLINERESLFYGFGIVSDKKRYDEIQAELLEAEEMPTPVEMFEMYASGTLKVPGFIEHFDFKKTRETLR